MVLHPNRIYWFQNTIGNTRSLLVEMMKASRIVWKSYLAFQKIQCKEKSDVAEVEHLASEYHKAVHGTTKKISKKISPEHIKILLNEIDKDFKKGNDSLRSLMMGIKIWIIKDETFLYRKVKELVSLYNQLDKSNFPAQLKFPILSKIFHLMVRMRNYQRHCWELSKAETKGAFKFANVSPRTNRREKNRVRNAIVEDEHHERHLKDLKNQIDRIEEIKTESEFILAHRVLENILNTYHEEFENIEIIMHEAHILMHRTEKMLHLLLHEATEFNKKMNINHIVRRIRHFKNKTNSILFTLQKQSLREYLQIKIITKKIEGKEFINHKHIHHTKIA